MANRRDLKKDLNWLTDVVISDCLIYVEVNTDKDHTPVGEIINEILIHRDSAFSEINKPTSGIKSKEVKQKYDKIVNDFLEAANSSLEKLSQLSKNNA
ncbi:MAG: hypothetical protein PHW82_08045 [Bacteroidales bacterium]|nr:hypothetical protein [Bacteroidales bacterium]